MRALRKANKPHNCDYCTEGIKKGEMYFSDRFRSARYDENDMQVGVAYIELKAHAEHCQAGDPNYIWDEMCDQHDFIWRGPSLKERYCSKCMRLEIQVYPDMGKWGLVPTGIKSWQHPKMSKAEIRAMRFNLIIREIRGAIRARAMNAISIENEIAFEMASQLHTNVDVQWKMNAVMINLDVLIKMNLEQNKKLSVLCRELLTFYRQLHDELVVELELRSSHSP